MLSTHAVTVSNRRHTMTIMNSISEESIYLYAKIWVRRKKGKKEGKKRREGKRGEIGEGEGEKERKEKKRR